MSLLTRLRDAGLVLAGKSIATPKSITTSTELEVIMSQLSDLTDRLSAALTRIAADKAAATAAAQADQTTIANLTTDKANLTQALNDAQTQIVNDLTPIVNQAETISPPPAA
jgi:uncharacterized protein involved in exopolysaccharide biosynthesis